MKLSDLKIGEIIKDSVFDWLGLTAEEYEGRKVLTFLNDEKYIEEVMKNKSVTSIITTLKIAEKIKSLNIGILISENPKKDFFELHNKLVEENFYFIKEKNKISSKALISPRATIGEYNIEIEDNVLIEDNVTIYPNTVIKKNSIIRAGSRIGGNAFEFSRFGDKVLSIKSAGKVIIKENVEIQNNNTIDKGVFGETILSKNVKTDNLVHIGHDVVIGENTFLTACVEISGRVKIGKNSYFGPNCTIRNGIIIGENAKITMGAVVTKNIKENETVTGNFAISHADYLKILKFLLKEVE
ncbi:UDP-3-O-(3-hydroxymyristoyl)glucosamine N-acyltransferase [uncultured Fusobacterium sp.]|uniref:UDP-3-O-(3-hydroxymyristoyl)glucosamine N-acyltransferase n=1 Tax=uncultured Fusobacterium sp. TaxID=159267 RepID=UPI0027DD0ECB|nr:UDP-3-O-(3-hydroxymyristoyl)glucosamine N-acyltransferase [uncultured Fusobacterium sp.]